jgi:hypothetical protein
MPRIFSHEIDIHRPEALVGSRVLLVVHAT